MAAFGYDPILLAGTVLWARASGLPSRVSIFRRRKRKTNDVYGGRAECYPDILFVTLHSQECPRSNLVKVRSVRWEGIPFV